jgi:predicted enzyme related to lactoylglutathione lyase
VDDDIKEHLKKVETARGKVFGEPWHIPAAAGLYLSVFDTEGNRVKHDATGSLEPCSIYVQTLLDSIV